MGTPAFSSLSMMAPKWAGAQSVMVKIAVGDGACDEERAGFDAIGDDGMGGAMKLGYAANAKRRGFVTLNVGAHFAEKMDEVGDFWFAGAIFEDGFTVGECGGHQNIFGAGDGNFVEDDVRAVETSAIRNFCLDVTVFGSDLRAHLFEGGEMEIDWASANSAAAGKGNMSYAGAGDGGAENQDGSPHGFDEFVGGDGVIERGGLNGVVGCGNLGGGDSGGHEGEKLGHGDDVADHRKAVQSDRLSGEQGCGHGRERGIFCAADGHCAVERFAAANSKFVHASLFSEGLSQISFGLDEALARGGGA